MRKERLVFGQKLQWKKGPCFPATNIVVSFAGLAGFPANTKRTKYSNLKIITNLKWTFFLLDKMCPVFFCLVFFELENVHCSLLFTNCYSIVATYQSILTLFRKIQKPRMQWNWKAMTNKGRNWDIKCIFANQHSHMTLHARCVSVLWEHPI